MSRLQGWLKTFHNVRRSGVWWTFCDHTSYRVEFSPDKGQKKKVGLYWQCLKWGKEAKNGLFWRNDKVSYQCSSSWTSCLETDGDNGAIPRYRKSLEFQEKLGGFLFYSASARKKLFSINCIARPSSCSGWVLGHALYLHVELSARLQIGCSWNSFGSELITCFFLDFSCFSSFSARSGVLWMQKLRTTLVGAKGYQRFPLSKSRVGI